MTFSSTELLTERSSTTGPPRIPLAVYVLVLGTFAIGTSEFMIAGLIEPIATDLAVSVPSAGLLVSAFAIGMVIGAPIMAVLTLRLPRRAVLLGALAVVLAAHIEGALASGYPTLLISRVIAATATGAFWAVGSVIAVDITHAWLRARAMALLIGGLTLANVAGVPLGTVLGQQLGWRSTFWAIAGLSILAMIGVRLWVPWSAADRTATVRRELVAFRRPRLWLALATTALFQTAVMGTVTYLSPLLTSVSGLSEGAVPAVFTALGVGSIIGTTLGGRFGDRYPWRRKWCRPSTATAGRCPSSQPAPR